MVKKLFVPVLTSLALLRDIAAQQTTTLSIYPDDPTEVDDLAGELLGTGADGTSYAISGVVSGLPVTQTIALGETHLSADFVFETLGAIFSLNQGCGVDADNIGSCTVVISGGSGESETLFTSVFPTTISLAPIPVEVTAAGESSDSAGPTGTDASETSESSTTGTAQPADDDSDSNSASALSRLVIIVAAAPILGFAIALW